MEAGVSQLRVSAWWTAFGLCAIGFGVHFLFIMLANMPTNPIKLDHYATIDTYVNPLFTQNWSLFAPQPISDDLSLFVRGERKNADHTVSVTPWFDVSDTLIEASNGKPLSPLALENLATSVAVVQFNNAVEKDSSDTFVHRGVKYVKPDIKSTVDPTDAEILARIGAAALYSRYEGVQMDRIQVALRLYQFPRFTHRDRPDRMSDGHLVRLEWMPAPNVVAL